MDHERSALPLCTFSPKSRPQISLVGITSTTLPNGNTIYYKYDGFGRLSRVIDHNDSVISTNSYNYKGQ